MGYGTYSTEARHARAFMSGYHDKPREQIFEKTSLDEAMNPRGVKLRESRDNPEHPNSFPLILGLDETGSMLGVPEYLVRHGLPQLMSKIIQRGIPDVQLMFLAIGDHETDAAPLQIGQFESSDDMLDHWLTKTYLEGGGGSNAGESYILAWYFAARYTKHDAFEKRGHKGLLVTIGDEPPLMKIQATAQTKIMGGGQFTDVSATEILSEAMERYHVYHIHTTQTPTGQRAHVTDQWVQLLGDHLITVSNSDEIVETIITLALKHGQHTTNAPDTQSTTIADQPVGESFVSIPTIL